MSWEGVSRTGQPFTTLRVRTTLYLLVSVTVEKRRREEMEDKVESMEKLEALCFRRAVVKDNDWRTL
jgi:hypothetical protein